MRVTAILICDMYIRIQIETSLDKADPAPRDDSGKPCHCRNQGADTQARRSDRSGNRLSPCMSGMHDAGIHDTQREQPDLRKKRRVSGIFQRPDAEEAEARDDRSGDTDGRRPR